MRQKKVEGEYQPDSWPTRPWSKAMPPRTTRYCDGPRVPDRSMVGTWLTTPQDIPFAGRARIVPRHKYNAAQQRGIAQVLDGLRNDPSDKRPRGLGCHSQRHRGGRSRALDIPLHRRIWAGARSSTWPHPPRSFDSLRSLRMTEDGVIVERASGLRSRVQSRPEMQPGRLRYNRVPGG
jgi:hypothetical protein